MGVDVRLYAKIKDNPKVVHKLYLDRAYKFSNGYTESFYGQWSSDIDQAIKEVTTMLLLLLSHKEGEPLHKDLEQMTYGRPENVKTCIDWYNMLNKAFVTFGHQWSEIVIAEDGVADEIMDEIEFYGEYTVVNIERLLDNK